jgi:hypothetical protein
MLPTLAHHDEAKASTVHAEKVAVAGSADTTDKNKNFVGVGGNGNLPGLWAVCGGYYVRFGSNGSGVFTRDSGIYGGVGTRSGSRRQLSGVGGTGGISFKDFNGRGTLFSGSDMELNGTALE